MTMFLFAVVRLVVSSLRIGAGVALEPIYIVFLFHEAHPFSLPRSAPSWEKDPGVADGCGVEELEAQHNTCFLS
jgi:hypothetical protein